MLRRSRRRRERLLLPGEGVGRRRFLQLGLVGIVLLAGAGASWLAWRRRDDVQVTGGPFAVLSRYEAAVLLGIARRVVPPGPAFPAPERVRVAERVDAFLAMSHRGVQRDVKRLLAVFDSAFLGFFLDAAPFRFVSASPARQDARLAAWSMGRWSFRRTGFRALRRLVCSAYYSSPEVWGSVGYPGPPALGGPPPPGGTP